MREDSLKRWYSFWVEKKIFTSDPKDAKEAFVVFLVPPNVTGRLHLGHALMITIQDLWLRWYKMRGRPIFCAPGLDHAGIATQYLVEQRLVRQGVTRQSLGRQRFLEEVWKWVAEYRPQIEKTFADLGLSCDWSYLTFTLDPHYCHAVATAFACLFEEGLIYQGDYVVNWCGRCKTTLSDLEVIKEKQPVLVHAVSLPLVNSSNSISVNLLHPELLWGTVAIAVHPDDLRYQQLRDAQVLHPLLERAIPIICDPSINPKIGTGAVALSPAHTPGHEILARQHGLEIINVIGEDGCLTGHAGPFAGRKAKACRLPIIAHLRAQGRPVQQQVIVGPVPVCSRCNNEITRRISKQWFVKMEPLALPILDLIEQDVLRFEPASAKQTSLHWLRNIHDWCISRQIWWGHPVPVATCPTCHTLILTTNAVESCPTCGGTSLEPSTDVLDTWFSCALWNFAVLGWPACSPAFEAFYPASVIETGRDILFFWVLRMVMLGYHLTGQLPANRVYLHGLVCDEHGRKMSKSLGNVINISDIVESHGADALRYVLLRHNRDGKDIRVNPDDFDVGSRLVHRLEELAVELTDLPRASASEEEPTLSDNLQFISGWVYSELANLADCVTTYLEHNAISAAAHTLDDFLSTFHKRYLPFLRFESRRAAPRVYDEIRALGIEAFLYFLRIAHPFMPFVTEELWHRLCDHASVTGSILEAPWPHDLPRDLDAEVQGATLAAIIDEIRKSLGNAAIDSYHQAAGIIIVPAGWEDRLYVYRDYISDETGIAPLQIQSNTDLSLDERWVVRLSDPIDITILIDRPLDSYRPQEIIDLRHRMKRLRDEAGRCRQSLNTPAFQHHAPQSTVDAKEERLATLYAHYRELRGNLKLLEHHLKGRSDCALS